MPLEYSQDFLGVSSMASTSSRFIDKYKQVYKCWGGGGIQVYDENHTYIDWVDGDVELWDNIHAQHNDLTTYVYGYSHGFSNCWPIMEGEYMIALTWGNTVQTNGLQPARVHSLFFTILRPRLGQKPEIINTLFIKNTLNHGVKNWELFSTGDATLDDPLFIGYRNKPFVGNEVYTRFVMMPTPNEFLTNDTARWWSHTSYAWFGPGSFPWMYFSMLDKDGLNITSHYGYSEKEQGAEDAPWFVLPGTQKICWLIGKGELDQYRASPSRPNDWIEANAGTRTEMLLSIDLEQDGKTVGPATYGPQGTNSYGWTWLEVEDVLPNPFSEFMQDQELLISDGITATNLSAYYRPVVLNLDYKRVVSMVLVSEASADRMSNSPAQEQLVLAKIKFFDYIGDELILHDTSEGYLWDASDIDNGVTNAAGISAIRIQAFPDNTIVAWGWTSGSGFSSSISEMITTNAATWSLPPDPGFPFVNYQQMNHVNIL